MATKRTPLGANVQRADPGKATDIARRLSTGGAPQSEPDTADMMETVSYHLPVDVIEEVTELASLRLRRDKRERRAARAKGIKPEGQARRSGSAVVREALDAHRDKIRAEIEALRAELGAG